MSIFDEIRHVDEDGIEFWYAREVLKLLGYTRFQNMLSVIEKVLSACKLSQQAASDHVLHVQHMISVGKGARRQVEDYKLSRYACYLAVQNSDPSKEAVAHGQTYFAIQTRKQEISDQFAELTEDQKRLGIREEMKEHNKQLVEAAKGAGVDSNLDYAIFQDEGYKGLYGGLTAKGIHYQKGLKKSQKILDHMGSEELAANLFRATQTESKLRREGIRGKAAANKAHNMVGRSVRKTIQELGGEMPENLPAPEKSIKQLERENASAHELPLGEG